MWWVDVGVPSSSAEVVDEHGLSEDPMTCETTQRLLALLRILERGPAPFGALGDDAVLDAWFGACSPVWPQTPQHRETPEPLPL